MTSIGVVDTPVLKFASRIEKVETRTEIEEIIKHVNEERHFGLFQLGGAIAVAHELFKRPKSEFAAAGYETFREYIEVVHGIPYGEAMRAIQTYRQLVQLESRGRR